MGIDDCRWLFLPFYISHSTGIILGTLMIRGNQKFYFENLTLKYLHFQIYIVTKYCHLLLTAGINF